MTQLSPRSASLLHQLMTMADARDALAEALEAEKADRLAVMRNHVSAGNLLPAAQAEAEVRLLEDFFPMLERYAAQHRVHHTAA